MEETAQKSRSDNSKYDTSWSSTTNWSISDGSLVNSITFESSFSPVAVVDDDDQDTGNSSSAKSPLILYPSSSDPTPCEITITFAQKREVRQVYVRSTARVYEIYYASDLKSSNEYLCTVRCGIATRDEEVLCTPSIEKVLCTPSIEEAATHLMDGSKELDQKKTKKDSNLNTDEDGWVEVKALDSPQLDNRRCPSSSDFNTKQGESIQDMYEATAEINDADSCTSITLKMLSLQNKGCIFVDEIYVFADPVEPSDSENRVGQMEKPAESSLMAMFMPTLLQLSKSRNVGQIRGDNSFDTTEKQKSHEIASKAIDPINITNKIQQGRDSVLADKQEEKLWETVGAAAIPAHTELEMPPQVSDTVCKPDLSYSRIEKVLDQLVSRVSRIEDLVLMFEERMLKPINSIDARLQRVEQQVEELKKPLNSKFQCCTRISAPEFSWHESDENLFENNENNEAESHEKDCTLSIPADELADSVNDGRSASSLLVNDPISPNANDREENNAQEAATGSTNDKPRNALSVDDALASALARFLSSASPVPPKYTQALAIKAPDFSVEEDSGGKPASSEVECGSASSSPISFNAVDETECNNDSLFENDVEVMKLVDDHGYEKVGEVVDNIHQHNEEGKDDSLDGDIHYTAAPFGLEVVTGDIKGIEVSDEMNTSVDDECKNGSQFLENQTDSSNTTQEGAVLNSESSTVAEVTKEQSEKDVLQDLKLSHAASLVNFETPILDVKFVSQENSIIKSSFEALWDGMSDSNVEAPCAKENGDDSQAGQQHNLISIDDSEPTRPASGNHLCVDMNYCSLAEIPLYAEGEKLPDYYMSISKEACAASLI